MGKLALLYNTYPIGDLIIDMKNGSRAYAFHYKPTNGQQQKIIFSYREMLAAVNGGKEYFNEVSRLEIKTDPDPKVDVFINVEFAYGMINIGHTRCIKNNVDSPQYDRIDILTAYNFNYNDMEVAFVNKPAHIDIANELEKLAQADSLDGGQQEEILELSHNITDEELNEVEVENEVDPDKVEPDKVE